MCHYTSEYRGTTHNVCNLKYSALKEITIIFHKVSNYCYRFIIKELVQEFKGICLVKNTEKYIVLLVPIEKNSSKLVKM